MFPNQNRKRVRRCSNSLKLFYPTNLNGSIENIFLGFIKQKILNFEGQQSTHPRHPVDWFNLILIWTVSERAWTWDFKLDKIQSSISTAPLHVFCLWAYVWKQKPRRIYWPHWPQARSNCRKKKNVVWTDTTRLNKNWEVKFIPSLCAIPGGGGGEQTDKLWGWKRVSRGHYKNTNTLSFVPSIHPTRLRCRFWWILSAKFPVKKKW